MKNAEKHRGTTVTLLLWAKNQYGWQGSRLMSGNWRHYEANGTAEVMIRIRIISMASTTFSFKSTDYRTAVATRGLKILLKLSQIKIRWYLILKQIQSTHCLFWSKRFTMASTTSCVIASNYKYIWHGVATLALYEPAAVIRLSSVSQSLS